MELDDIVHRPSTFLNDAVFQPLGQFFLGLNQEEWVVLISILGGAIAFGYSFARARTYHTTVFQNRGESLVSRVVSNSFGYPNYHLMNHVTIQMEDGTTQVDHILVSRFGVFVIETKDYKGWIFGSARQKNWTQVLYRAKFRFQNPIHQNMRHIGAVRELLHFLAPDAIKSVVVFTGDAEFRTEIPHGVFSIVGLVDYLHGQADEIISPEHLQLCVGRLEMDRLAISGQTDIEHVQSLERRHGRAA